MARGNDLAAILVDERIVGKRDLERVERARRGRPLWAALLEAGLTSEDELFFLLAAHLPGAVATDDLLAQVEVPAPLRDRFTHDQALAAGLLPVEIAGEHATVVMVDPTDATTLAAFVAGVGVRAARPLLGRRALIEQAVARAYGAGAVDDEPKIQIDPSLAAEIKRMGPRVLRAEPLTPVPRLRRRRAMQQMSSPSPSPSAPTSSPTSSPTLGSTSPSIQGALESEERLTRVLLSAVEVLARELERRLEPADSGESGRIVAPRAGELARLGRRVARQLGLDRRAVDQIGVAAQLFAVDRRLRQVDDAAARALTAELGWPAAGEEGLAPILRALTAAADGFGRSAAVAPPLGARIVSVIHDYLELAGSGEADLGTVSQLLRASAAGAPVIDALLRVLEAEHADPTPENSAATSSDEKTVRRAAPKRPKESTPR